MTKSIFARGRRGQATVEYAIAFSSLLLPVTFAIVYTSQLLWIWHSVTDFTRNGARYATTHCWQGDGENVRTWMKNNTPLMFDRDQFQSGSVEIQVTYMSRDADSGQLAEFSCDGGDCSTSCVPDVVTVKVTNYEFRTFVTNYLGLAPVTLPDFHMTLAMQSAGCDPEQGTCLP
jgi:Flp pilus assembly protein TadG